MRWFLNLDFIIWLSCTVVGALIKTFLLDDSLLSFFATGTIVVIVASTLSKKAGRKRTSDPTLD